MKTKYVMISALVVIVLMMAPSVGASAVQPKTDFHWGRIIEAHCDARYWVYSDNNVSWIVPTFRYWVLAIGRHTINAFLWISIQRTDGSFFNYSTVQESKITMIPFKPIANFSIDFRVANYKTGWFYIVLVIDGNSVDYEYSVVPENPPW